MTDERPQGSASVDHLRLRAFVDAARDALVCVDTAGAIVEWTGAAERLFGWTRAEALGRVLPELLLRPGDAAHAKLFEAREGEARSEPVLLRAVHHSGKEIPVEVLVSASRATGALEWQAVFRDVRQQKEREREEIHAQRLDAIGTLSASVAHDFNNALAVIISFACLLRDSLPEASEQREDAETIIDSARRAATLTRQLLAFARKQPIEPRVIDTTDELERLSRSFRPLLPEIVSFETTIAERLSRINIDPSQLEQVLLNLVVNARDAMPDGGTISLGARNMALPDPSLTETPLGLAPGRYVEMSVSDTGVGVPEEIRARIFEPLFTTKALGRGTGLGLATVRAILDQLGGAATLATMPGQGSIFRVYFPRAKTQGPVTLQSVGPATALRGTETVMLVEDDDHVRGVVRRVLTQAGYVVLDCPSPGEALLIVERDPRKPALVITDVMLPRLSGYELVERLIAQEPKMKVLLISGYAPRPSPWAFLAKPFIPTDLLRKVRELLDGASGA